MPDDGKDVNYKDIALAVPALGTAIAITYDVGYFWGLDIKTFGFFSLTEHIVFALEALPIALVVSGLLVALFIALEKGRIRGRREGEEIAEQVKQGKISEEKVRRILLKEEIKQICVFLFLATYAIFLVWSHQYGVGVGMLCVATVMGGWMWLGDVSRQRPMLQVSMALSVLLTAFATGVQMQEHQRNNTAGKHILLLGEGGEMKGGVLRSGERGLLFVDTANRQLTFIKWDQIKQIKSISSLGDTPTTPPSAPMSGS